MNESIPSDDELSEDEVVDLSKDFASIKLLLENPVYQQYLADVKEKLDGVLLNVFRAPTSIEDFFFREQQLGVAQRLREESTHFEQAYNTLKHALEQKQRER